MLFYLTLIAGLILWLTDGWFDQQHTVGLVLLIVAGIMFVFYLIAVRSAKKMMKAFDRRR